MLPEAAKNVCDNDNVPTEAGIYMRFSFILVAYYNLQ